MLLVLARRVGNMVPTLAAVIALIFVLFSVIPGSFMSGLGDDGRTIDPAVMERMRKEMGLDQPLLERFVKYAGATLVGDLGTSFRTREPVTKLIAGRLWPSLKLTMAAMLVAMMVGIPLGFVAALTGFLLHKYHPFGVNRMAAGSFKFVKTICYGRKLHPSHCK